MPRRLHAALAGYLDSYLAPSALQCQWEAEVGFASLSLSLPLSCSLALSHLTLSPVVPSYSIFIYLAIHLSIFLSIRHIGPAVDVYLKYSISLCVFLFHTLSTNMHFQFDVDLVPADLSLLGLELPITTPGAFTFSISHSLG